MTHYHVVLRNRIATAGRVLLVGAVLGACAGRVSPPGAVSPDRPGFTDTPPVLPSGAFQIEAGFTDDRASGGVEYTAIGEALLRIGVGGRSELRLFGNSYATRAQNGIPSEFGREDPKIGMKTSLLTKPDSVHSVMPNLSALVGLTLPLGELVFRGLHAQPEGKLAMNWTTPSPFSVYSNVGVGSVFDGAAWGHHSWVSTALWYAVNPRVSFFGEGIAVRRLSGSAVGSNDVDTGITVLVDDRLQFDIRVGRGLGANSASERFIGAGVARRW